jgi:hypothetical protein
MRNRDFRGRFIKNTKPQKEDETSTQKAKETETEILGRGNGRTKSRTRKYHPSSNSQFW